MGQLSFASIWNSLPSTLWDSSLSLRAFKGRLKVVDNNEHHMALMGRFVIVAPSINVQTYLLTYLLTYPLHTRVERVSEIIGKQM